MRAKLKFSATVVGVLLIGVSRPSIPSCVAREQGHRGIHPASTGALIDLGESRGYRIGLSMPTPRIAVFHDTDAICNPSRPDC
jgi:hypothetical protein